MEPPPKNVRTLQLLGSKAQVSNCKIIGATTLAGSSLSQAVEACLAAADRAAKSKPRLVLIVNLASAFEGVEGTECIYRAVNRHALDDGTANTGSLLNL